MSRLAIYPGSFDPVTYGHLDVIKRAQSIFGTVVVAVANNASKKYIFSVEERVAMMKEVTHGMKGVRVDVFQGLVTEYAKSKKTNVLIRGLRMISDFDYEFQMALTNRRLAESIETVFLMPSERFSFLSATLIKEVARLDADISSFVPKQVAKRLRERLNKGTAS
ncbi:MAG: pantetheine-phosphate adenylyltransferase [Candidatus Omnitrophica bacterium]|nr:pantetheine-phosphate adenylyltransferase [Candidatus Omnitrophota bacterium]